MFLAQLVQIYLSESICLSEYLLACVETCVSEEATCGMSRLPGEGRVLPRECTLNSSE